MASTRTKVRRRMLYPLPKNQRGIYEKTKSTSTSTDPNPLTSGCIGPVDAENGRAVNVVMLG